MRRFTLLEASGLSSGYPGGPQVIHDIDIDIAEHEIVTIIGSNGAGKSTLLRSVSGSLAPASGKVVFMGENVTGLPAHELVRRGMSLVASGRQVVAGMTVRDNLLVGAHVLHKDRTRVARLLDEAFERFPVLGRKHDHDAATLSGGEQQLLVMSRGLMSRPRLLLLDEPSLGLAPKVVTEIAQLIGHLREEGTTILMVEKLANLALGISDRVAVLELGRLVFFDTAAAARGNPAVEDAYLGRSVTGP